MAVQPCECYAYVFTLSIIPPPIPPAMLPYPASLTSKTLVPLNNDTRAVSQHQHHNTLIVEQVITIWCSLTQAQLGVCVRVQVGP